MQRAALHVLCALAITSPALADPPQVPSDPPFIVLRDNLDEPNGFGFCLDTAGRGKTDLMHAHTCKPARPDAPRDSPGNDTRFRHDAQTGQIASHAFDGFCVQVLRGGPETVFALLACADHPRQVFRFNTPDHTLRLGEDDTVCLAVSDTTLPAGPWVKRDLTLMACDAADRARLQWRVASP